MCDVKNMEKIDDIFIKNLPTIDLHGYDRDSARVATNDFINEAVMLQYDKVIIIHGIGSGIVKEVVHETLARNKMVVDYHVYGMNVGCTIIKIKV